MRRALDRRSSVNNGAQTRWWAALTQPKYTCETQASQLNPGGDGIPLPPEAEPEQCQYDEHARAAYENSKRNETSWSDVSMGRGVREQGTY